MCFLSNPSELLHAWNWVRANQKANWEKQKVSDCTSLAPVVTAPAVKEELADMLAAALAAPLMVTCSWTPYLPSHRSSLLIWVELVIVVSLISASVEEAT